MKTQAFKGPSMDLSFSDEILKMAHDMRAPMSALMAVMDSPGEIDQHKKTLAKKAIWRALHLVESILILNQKQKVETPFYNINDSVQGIIEEQKLTCPSHIQIELHEDQKSIFHELETVKQIEHILCNILQNAIQALEPLEKGKIRVHIKTRYSKTYIKIEDNGPGIPGHIRRKIGIMPITYMKQNGNGLGLYHSKKIMNELGGRLVIRSRGGVGTAVTLII